VTSEESFTGFDPHPWYMIKKIKNKYVVLNETTGRKFGTYKTLKEAKIRLRQVEFFKHAKMAGVKLRNRG